jgi:1,4-alpha-glucan branching enzyme
MDVAYHNASDDHDSVADKDRKYRDGRVSAAVEYGWRIIDTVVKLNRKEEDTLRNHPMECTAERHEWQSETVRQRQEVRGALRTTRDRGEPQSFVLACVRSPFVSVTVQLEDERGEELRRINCLRWAELHI